MELLVWQIADEHWQQDGFFQYVTAHREGGAQWRGVLAGLATAAAIAPVTASIWSSGQTFLLIFGLNLLLPVIVGFVFRGLVRRLTRQTLGRDLPVVPLPPRVELTATGILVGGRGWQWRAEQYRLASAELDEQDPLRLRLTFRGVGLRRLFVADTLELPFSTDLEQDLEELLELLRARAG